MESDDRATFLLNRARHPRNEAAVFMETRVLVADQPAPVYIEALNRFAPPQEARQQEEIRQVASNELWKQANDEKEKLFALMEQVRTKLAKQDSTNVQAIKHDLRKCTWDQVLQDVQGLTSRWASTTKKSSKMMKCLGMLKENSEVFESWLDLLPNGDYGSSICGVFTLVLGAVGQYAKVEEAIFDALAGIPEIIDGARRYIEIYQRLRDHLLERKTFDLYLSILKALTHVMRFLADSTFRKDSLLYTECLDTDHRKLGGSRKRRKAIQPPRRDTQNIEKAAQLVNMLRFDPEATARDIEICLRLGEAMDDPSKARATAFIRHPNFKTYMTEDSSSGSLLVNGNEDLSTAEGPSPLSLVAARLARICEETENGLALKYFCGEHRPYTGDPLASSPTGMVASLLGQLASHMLDKGINTDLSFLSIADWASIKKLKMSTLFLVLQGLILQLPRKSLLLCIIDEAALYDTGLLRGETDGVFKRLTHLVDEQQQVVFKLVVTCRGRALNIGQYFAGHTLEMDETAEVDDSSTWQIANISI
ncbi:hypothetical protein GQ53DRAFT_728957 [Thozetella sp. PMI_491]|nr:hypothetical protein GQ53DRAFT_728957 [Thozetella sp. PMI_491]